MTARFSKNTGIHGSKGISHPWSMLEWVELTRQVISVLSSFCDALATLVEDLDEDFHRTDEDGRESFDTF